LDNLPHVKIVVPPPAIVLLDDNHDEQGELHNRAVNDDNVYRKVLVPLQDSLLQRVLQHYPVQLSATIRNSNRNGNNHTAGAAN
jgi:hypothetical protein